MILDLKFRELSSDFKSRDYGDVAAVGKGDVALTSCQSCPSPNHKLQPMYTVMLVELDHSTILMSL